MPIHFSDARLLIVDDQPTIRQLIRANLEMGGFRHFAEAATADEALALAKRQNVPFTLALIDVVLPGGKDGFDLVTELRQSPDTRALPVMFLTALRDTASRQRGWRMGALDVVSKPILAEELISRVSTHAERALVDAALRERVQRLADDLEDARHLQESLLPQEADFASLARYGLTLDYMTRDTMTGLDVCVAERPNPTLRAFLTEGSLAVRTMRAVYHRATAQVGQGGDTASILENMPLLGNDPWSALELTLGQGGASARVYTNGVLVDAAAHRWPFTAPLELALKTPARELHLRVLPLRGRDGA
jgi:DNA-binding response OmpR family regulator